MRSRGAGTFDLRTDWRRSDGWRSMTDPGEYALVRGVSTSDSTGDTSMTDRGGERGRSFVKRGESVALSLLPGDVREMGAGARPPPWICAWFVNGFSLAFELLLVVGRSASPWFPLLKVKRPVIGPRLILGGFAGVEEASRLLSSKDPFSFSLSDSAARCASNCFLRRTMMK